MYEIFPHTADLGLRVEADSIEQLFSDAARGLFAMIVANPDEIAPREQIDLEIAGDEIDYLLFDWLSELLYTFESRHLLLCRFDVKRTAEGISATCQGETADAPRHQLDHEVKAITYHQLQAEQHNGHWHAEVIVDI